METAVEWLEKRFLETDGNLYAEDFTKAKEMEKQQIIDFADNYVDNCVIPNENMAIPTIMDVPQYYNETFKSE